jgi:hypothetical protein
MYSWKLFLFINFNPLSFFNRLHTFTFYTQNKVSEIKEIIPCRYSKVKETSFGAYVCFHSCQFLTLINLFFNLWHLEIFEKNIDLNNFDDLPQMNITRFFLIRSQYVPCRFLLRPPRSHQVIITRTSTCALRPLRLDCALITFLLRLERPFDACTTHLSRSNCVWTGYHFIYSSQYNINMS